MGRDRTRGPRSHHARGSLPHLRPHGQDRRHGVGRVWEAERRGLGPRRDAAGDPPYRLRADRSSGSEVEEGRASVAADPAEVARRSGVAHRLEAVRSCRRDHPMELPHHELFPGIRAGTVRRKLRRHQAFGSHPCMWRVDQRDPRTASAGCCTGHPGWRRSGGRTRRRAGGQDLFHRFSADRPQDL